MGLYVKVCFPNWITFVSFQIHAETLNKIEFLQIIKSRYQYSTMLFANLSALLDWQIGLVILLLNLLYVTQSSRWLIPHHIETSVPRWATT